MTEQTETIREKTMLKKLISFALVCVIAVSCSITCFATTTELVKTDLPAPQKIVFLGDSIAAGYGLEGYSDNGGSPKDCYASILGERYKKEIGNKCEAIMINAAVSGDTSAQLLEKLETGSLDNYIFGSNAVVISIGGNDIMGPALEFLSEDLGLKSEEDIKNFNTLTLAKPSVLAKINEKLNKISSNLETFKSNLDRIITNIRSKTQAVIVFQTVYDPLEEKKSIKAVADMMGGMIKELNSIITQGAKGSDGSDRYLVCDVYEGFKGKSLEYTNIEKFDIHPSAEGHKQIAELVDKQIKTQKYSFEELVEKEDAPKAKKMSSTRIYVTIGLFFGGFIVLFMFVWIKFRRDTR